MLTVFRQLVFFFSLLFFTTHLVIPGNADTPDIHIIANNLNSPRGVAVMSDGSLIVIEAGDGATSPGDGHGSGQITRLTDFNQDGDFNDEGERTTLFNDVVSYNSLNLFRTGHDEVFGLGDIAVLPDGRIFYTKDDPFAVRDHNTPDLYNGDTGIFILDAETGESETFINRSATLNALTFDQEHELFYTTESGFNRIASSTLSGEVEVVVELPTLSHDQQPVPAGIAIDPTTGDVLVALFSGFVYDYYETTITFMPGDARIMRYKPTTGELLDEITGLTTAIDLAVDPEGNIYVVELNTAWPPPFMPYKFDLHDPNALPDPGGYARFTGRVTKYPAGGGEPIILANGLDTPTNITYTDGAVYVSAGLGTPGRRILGPTGLTLIEGVIYQINLSYQNPF